jgi:hypothetical protein
MGFQPLQPPSRQPGPPAYFPAPQQQQHFPHMQQQQMYAPSFGQFQAPTYPPLQQQPSPAQVGVPSTSKNKRKKKKAPAAVPSVAASSSTPIPVPTQIPQLLVPPPLQQVPFLDPASLQPPTVSAVATTPLQPVVGAAAVLPGAGKVKKAVKCWKCAVDTHATKDCKVQHYCLVCDNTAHPTSRCPTLRLPRPSAFVAAQGFEESLFLELPDSVYKPHLVPACSPTALVKLEGPMVAASVIERQMARIFPAPLWKWEALAHGSDAFLIGFPSAEDLERVDGFQMKVQSSDTQLTISTW